MEHTNEPDNNLSQVIVVAVDLTDASDTAVFFCIHTYDALGPDNDPVGPRLCASWLVCFRPVDQ